VAAADGHRNGGGQHAERPGPERFSLFEEAPFWQCILGPGDGLYIPRHACETPPCCARAPKPRKERARNRTLVAASGLARALLKLVGASGHLTSHPCTCVTFPAARVKTGEDALSLLGTPWVEWLNVL
jgi:hypothetical protein